MTLEAQVEIERKYDVGPGADLPDLARASGVAGVDPLDPVELEAVYYDTEDHALRRHRVTLRRRTGGRDDGWHVKFPSAEGRLELRAPLGKDAGAVPHEVADVVQALVRGRRLRPAATLRTRRTVTLLCGRDGPLAEVCDDEVFSTGPDGTEERWREWEVELLHDGGLEPDEGDDLLDAVETLLADAGARRSPRASKLARALGPLPAPPSSAPGKGSLRAVLAGAFGAAAAALFVWDPRVRRGVPDALHQLRVAVRTLRGLLKVVRRLLAPGPAGELNARLRETGRALGAARDAEVHLQTLAARLERWPREVVPQQAAERMRTRLEAERDAALARALDHLRSPGYLETLDAVEAFAADPPLADADDDGGAARKPLRKAVDRQLRRVLRGVDAADAAADDGERTRLLHEARKEAKTLRYTVRLLRDVPGARLGGSRKALQSGAEDVQDALGGHRDSLAFQGFVRSVARQARRAGQDTFGYGALFAAEEAVQEEALAAFRDALESL